MEQDKASIIFDSVSLTFSDGVFAEGKRAVLSGLNLRLRERRIALIGANGSGKSSFLRLINGLLLPSAGAVCVGGLDTARHGAAIRGKTGFMFQNPNMQIIMPTVAEDIAFGLHNLRDAQKLTETEITARATQIMADYGLTDYADWPARGLSGGQKQILALCGILVMQPEIILFDEPTNQLDLRHKNRFAALIKNLPQQLILATHDLSLIQDFDRVLVLDNGQIAYDGAPQAAIPFYQNLMAANP